MTCERRVRSPRITVGASGNRTVSSSPAASSTGVLASSPAATKAATLALVGKALVRIVANGRDVDRLASGGTMQMGRDAACFELRILEHVVVALERETPELLPCATCAAR